MNYQNFIRLTLLITFCVIVLGAYTRLADAGLGCPDWPGCYGQILVPSTSEEVENKAYLEQRPLEPAKGWAEMVHRYFAGALGLMVLAITVWSWLRNRRDIHQPVWLPSLLLAVVIFQAILGMWTVTLLLKPVVVMGHLLGGFTTFSLLFLLLLITTDRYTVFVDQRMRGRATFGLMLLVAQIALGGWVSTNYAALACTDFPTCQGSWWPEMDFSEAFVMWRGLGVNYEFGVLEHPARTAIHLTHRIGAAIVFVYIGLLSIALVKRGGELSNAGLLLGVLLLIQVGLGISNVVLHLPLGVAVAHNAVAALLLLSMIYVTFLLWRQQH
jgi:cytochrome c oxidase assembly protein subunit 15